MSHPYSKYSMESVGKARAKAMVGKGMASGGSVVKKAMAAHDKQLHGGKHTDLSVIGEPSKYARGGRAKSKKKKDKEGTQINIAIIGAGEKEEAAPPMPPMPMPPMGGAEPPMPGGGMPMPPPGGGTGGMPPGMGMMNRGGKVPMKGGAESGVGRLDKIKAYGGKAKK